MVKIGKYNYEKSTRPDKKLMVKVGNRMVHFGSSKMEHFKDKTGIWKEKNHLDAARRKSYRSRAAGIKKKDGTRAIDNPLSGAYHSYRILW